MKIVQITPGAGAMYCGNCFRDNALVASLRRMGHTALMVPLYLPMTLDEANRAGRLKAGDTIAMMAIGAGMSWGSALVRW